MDLCLKMFNSMLVTAIWLALNRKRIKTITTSVILFILVSVIKIYLNAFLGVMNILVELVQVSIVSAAIYISDKPKNMVDASICSLTFILSKAIWIIGAVITIQAFAILGIKRNPYLVAIITLFPITVITKALKDLLQKGIEELNKKFVTIIAVVAWVLYSVSCTLLTETYTGEDRTIRGFAVLSLVILFIILVLFLIKVITIERKNKNLLLHIDDLVHNAHRSKELIPGIVHELYIIQKSIQDGYISGLSERVSKAIKEVTDIQIEMGIETQEAYLVEQNFDSTGLDILDSQLKSEQLRALHHGVNFDVIVNSPITPLINVVISQLHIQRLIGDLYRDALAATEQGSEAKEIMLIMGMVDGSYQIRMCDTGTLFPAAVLHNLGAVIQSQDRKHYGYADIFEVLSKCAASITIEEFPPQKRLFTKAVSIKFDGLAELRINSYRTEVCDRVCDIHLIVEETRRERSV